MPQPQRRQLIFFALIFFTLLYACPKEESAPRLTLPTSRQERMSFALGWGVVLTNYVRIRLEPKADAPEVTALAKGSIVRVLDKGKLETFKNVTAYWYQIDDGKNRGWLFGSHLAFFYERSQAEAFQAKLKEPQLE